MAAAACARYTWRMRFHETTAVILGEEGPLSVSLADRLRHLGADVSPDGPADYLFHFGARGAGQSAPLRHGEIVLTLERAARQAARLRHICLVQEVYDDAPADFEEAQRRA